MKKISIFLISMVFFLGINTVSADEIRFEYDEDFSSIQSKIDILGKEKLNQFVNSLIEYYESNYSEDFPYFYISIKSNLKGTDDLTFVLTAVNNLEPKYVNLFFQSNQSLYRASYSSSGTVQKFMTYDFTTDTLSDIYTLSGTFIYQIFSVHSNGNYYYPYNFYYSNYDFYYYGTLFTKESDDLSYLNPDDDLFIPNFDDSSIYSIHKANSDFLLEPYSLYDDNLSLKSSYIEIDLNQYPYVALSLKDYTKRDTFYTNVYVKGNYCLTSVYNYGMTEKKDILSGYKSQRCSTYYDDYTIVRTYILSQDIENNAIYYLKAYDTSKDNLVKVDSSIFDITYITEETEENPYVNIGDKTYPTIAYDKLTDTATKSEAEDYISGVSCQVGDFNCFNENNPENIFDEVFSSPLNFLKGIWSSITTIFDIIGEFITLLPEPMQSFLYLSFMVAVILGLLKIIL